MPNATEQYPAEKQLVLRKPISFADKKIDFINLSEPTAGQLRKVDKLSGLAFSITLVSLNSGIPESGIESMGQRDLNDAMDYLLGFYKPDPKPGEPSSAA